VLQIPDPQELRRRAFAALREILTRLAGGGPLVLALDDLQWGDVDSALLLSELLRPPEAPVLLLLACYRSEDVVRSPFLQAFLRTAEQQDDTVRRELAVEPLSPEESIELARELLDGAGEAARSRAEEIARESAGNPFFL